MKKISSLSTNSTIGIICPSSPQTKEYIDSKISNFQQLGFKIEKSPHIYDSKGYLAGSDNIRALDLMNMFKDPNIDAIVCFRGGYGSMRLLKHLDLSIIRKNPKIFCGYSDITLLLNYFSSNCNFPTFHSPMINSDFNDILTKKHFLGILENLDKSYSYYLDDLNSISYINKKNFSGRIVGGNLSIICSSLGTPYEIDFKNSILLLEDVDEPLYSIDRMLFQLITSNKLRNCKGIILGQFTNCNEVSSTNTLTLPYIVTELLSPLDIPIIINFPCGHSYPNLTVPIGAFAEFNSTKNILNFKF